MATFSGMPALTIFLTALRRKIVNEKTGVNLLRLLPVAGLLELALARRDSVRVLLEVRMDRLALKFHETKDLKVRDEIYRLCRELIELDKPWQFVVIRGLQSCDNTGLFVMQVTNKKRKPRYSARGVLNEYPDFCPTVRRHSPVIMC
jgi:hypothetical protein